MGMGGKKRKWIWGIFLTLLIALFGAFILGKMWIDHHLKRVWNFGETQVQLYNPKLRWSLHFQTDSIAVINPEFALHSGMLQANLGVWQSLIQLKPTLALKVDNITLVLPPDTLTLEEKKRRKKPMETLVFPDFRFPIPFQFRVDQIEMHQGENDFLHLNRVKLASQRQKGILLEIHKIAWKSSSSADSLSQEFNEVESNIYLAARWYGRSFKYQMRLLPPNGDFFRLEGTRLKANLFSGSDSIDLSMQDLFDYSKYLSNKNLPSFTNVQFQGKVSLDSQINLKTHLSFTTPKIELFGPQHIDVKLAFADSLGKMNATVQGDSGENVYLQGPFQFPIRRALDDFYRLDSISNESNPNRSNPNRSNPNKSNQFAAFLKPMTASFSGFSKNVQLHLGPIKMPADMEIKKISIHGGLNADAEVRTRDSSLVYFKAWHEEREAQWHCTFKGTVHPKESWAHGWTDTNISFRQAQVEGEFGNHKIVEVSAKILSPSAYGALADSLYAKQVVTVNGYYLLDSRVYWKGTYWPVKGKVEWGLPNPISHIHNSTALEFHTSHPQYGTVSYSMPRDHYMQAKVEDVDVDKFPYSRIPFLMALKPRATGFFNWDFLAQKGETDLQADFEYGGEKLHAGIEGNWNPQKLNLNLAHAEWKGAKMEISSQIKMHAKPFYEIYKVKPADIQSLSLETDNLDAGRLSVFFGEHYPVQSGILNGHLVYADSTGFGGEYQGENINFRFLKNIASIKSLSLKGNGQTLNLALRTKALGNYPFLNDSISLRMGQMVASEIMDTSSAVHDRNIEMQINSLDGLALSLKGQSRDFRNFQGSIAILGPLLLPESGLEIKDIAVKGNLAFPFSKDILSKMKIDSGVFSGRYAMPGLDTQSIQGNFSLADGKALIPNLMAENAEGISLTGKAEANITGPLNITSKLHGENIGLRFPNLENLVFHGADADLTFDSTGLFVTAKANQVDFKSSYNQSKLQGNLEKLSLSYHLPRTNFKSSNLADAPISHLMVNTKLRNFNFQHKLGFNEIKRYFRTVKVDKKKKRTKPMDIQINVETLGLANHIETDILRMNFTGDLNVHGIYPYTLMTGQFSSVKGELGQSNQSYDISDFDLKWQNATMEEGKISIEGTKRLRYDCKPETKRTCGVFIQLGGRLDDMAFTYDSDCGSNSGGEAIDPAELINSVSRGCYAEQSGAGGGNNYGEAMVNFLEPTINEQLSNVGNRYSFGWIKSTQVSGVGSAITGDSTQPLAIGVESKEKWGMKFKAKAGYHQEFKTQSPWQNKVSLEWRPPLEIVAPTQTWKRRVQDRVMLEVSAETGTEEKIIETENKAIRKQVGLRYHYKFWDLW